VPSALKPICFQRGGHDGILRLWRGVAQGIGKLGVKDQVIRDTRRIEGHARIGKGKIGGQLRVGRAELAERRQPQRILDVQRVLQVFRPIHADPAPDHHAVVGGVDAGTPSGRLPCQSGPTKAK
jgi:hypothetical protein